MAGNRFIFQKGNNGRIQLKYIHGAMRWIGNSCEGAMNRRYESPLTRGPNALNTQDKSYKLFIIQKVSNTFILIEQS